MENDLTQHPEKYDELKDCIVVGMITYKGKFVRRSKRSAWIAVRTQSGNVSVSKYRVQEIMMDGKYLTYGGN